MVDIKGLSPSLSLSFSLSRGSPKRRSSVKPCIAIKIFFFFRKVTVQIAYGIARSHLMVLSISFKFLRKNQRCLDKLDFIVERKMKN